MGEGGFGIEEERLGGQDGSTIWLRGELSIRHAGDLRRELLTRIRVPSVVRLDLSGVTSLDGGAASVLADAWSRSVRGGAAMHFVGAKGHVNSVLELYTERAARDCMRPEPGGEPILEQVGRATRAIVLEGRGALEFLGDGVLAIRAAIRTPRRMNWPDVRRLAERHGADGLPIVLTISFLIGVITAFQAAAQLHRFGADIFVADLVGLSITRELGPLMAAIVLAGRSGAAIAAELGTMKVSEEVDALRTLGLCPFGFLVFPRILALALVAPVLTLLGDAVGIAGGLLVTVFQLDVSMQGYLNATREAVGLWDVFGGLIKAFVFGLIIATIACERGLATRGGAEGVGRSTTSAVVTILFHLIMADAMFTVLFQQLGI